MEDLQKVAPSKSPDELVGKIRSSFSNDDITLKGYREGNEAEVRVSLSPNQPARRIRATRELRTKMRHTAGNDRIFNFRGCYRPVGSPVAGF